MFPAEQHCAEEHQPKSTAAPARMIGRLYPLVAVPPHGAAAVRRRHRAEHGLVERFAGSALLLVRREPAKSPHRWKRSPGFWPSPSPAPGPARRAQAGRRRVTGCGAEMGVDHSSRAAAREQRAARKQLAGRRGQRVQISAPSMSPPLSCSGAVGDRSHGHVRLREAADLITATGNTEVGQ